MEKDISKEVVYYPNGIHVILDCWDCSFVDLDDVDKAISFVENVVNDANMHMLDMSFKKFEPQGLTLIGLLSESHISIHTYPEHGYMAIDLFTCGENNPVEPLLNNLNKYYGNVDARKAILTRGDRSITNQQLCFGKTRGNLNGTL